MTRWTVVAATLLLAFNAAGSQEASLGRIRWLSGCWEQRTTNRVVVEMWMPPMADLMIGGSRTVVRTATREFEHLRIRAEGGKLVYTAIPSGQQEASFPVVVVSDTSIVFENLAHDFPQRITYRRRGADSLVARVEGPGPNNTTRGFDLPMRRVSCTDVSPPPA